jgi:hypothetical protein
MSNNDDHDHNRDNDRDRNGRGDAPALRSSTSLASLSAALNNVDMGSLGGRSGMPLLQFKSRDDGLWTYGQRRTVVEEGSQWAINPTSFMYGFVCFDDNNKVVGERLVPISQPKPDPSQLPDKGFAWQEEWAVNLKCLTGTDAGVEVVFKTNTYGGIQALAGMIDTLRDRLNGGQHDSKVSPVVHLERSSYPHPKHGRIYTPLLTIVGWIPLEGPAPTAPPASVSSPTEQPRRRRVA